LITCYAQFNGRRLFFSKPSVHCTRTADTTGRGPIQPTQYYITKNIGFDHSALHSDFFGQNPTV
jgi:hypothetical protein